MGMESPETAQKADDSYRVSDAVGVCPEPATLAGFSFGGRSLWQSKKQSRFLIRQSSQADI
jgi:hypothetical protein